MTNILDIGKEISFQEDIHQYKNKAGQVLSSTTQLLSLYKEPFDPTGIIAAMCAKREGITKDDIQKRWKQENKRSCDYGHSIHSQIEHFLKTGEILDTEEKKIVKNFSKIKFKGDIFSEVRLKSDKYLLAGTCDIAAQYKDIIYIHDIKSNKRFDFKSKYNKNLLYPINHLSDCHINSYSLQILIYGEMVKEHGFNFEPGYLLWINPEDKKIEKYDVLDLSKEVNDLLNHYKESFCF